MKFIIHIALATSLTLFACESKVDRPDPVLSPQEISKRNAQIEPSTIPLGSQSTSALQHYYCPNNCVGSGGDNDGTCPVCGTAYAHNQAYHNTPAANNSGAGINSSSSAVPEPAQNAAGVWHYTCSNGCSGGAGSAIACTQCGNTLVHNNNYHN